MVSPIPDDEKVSEVGGNRASGPKTPTRRFSREDRAGVGAYCYRQQIVAFYLIE